MLTTNMRENDQRECALRKKREIEKSTDKTKMTPATTKTKYAEKNK